MAVDLKLVIGNKNYSSWSMRPWVLLRQAGIPFEEIQLKFDDDARVIGVSRPIRPTGRCRCCAWTGRRCGTRWRSAKPSPSCFRRSSCGRRTRQARALARSVCAEMHAGFREPAHRDAHEHPRLASRARA